MTTRPKKHVYLIDLVHKNKIGLGSDAMPLQLGLVGAYCLETLGDDVEIELFKFLDDFERAVEKNPPALVGVSNYIWNIELGYTCARILKEKHPETIFVFGGPNYPDVYEEQVEFLKERPLIDFHVYKDGEVPFRALIEFLIENDWDVEAAKRAQLPSCHTLVQGEPMFGETAPRLRDLTIVPSPYTTGLMDKFFEQKLVPAIQTNRGCPFTCTFCTEGGRYYNKVFKSNLERKIAEVDYIAERSTHTKTLRITDSNFGMFTEDQDFCRHLGKLQESHGYPEYLSCSTGKNRKERILECNKLLNGAMRLTASVQSLDPEVLSAIKRKNISVDALMYVSDETSDTDTHAYSEIILGLPGDSAERHVGSIEGLMEIGIGNITQHQLALIHGTELNNRESRRTHEYRSGFRPIQRCLGKYSFLGEDLIAIEIEEIVIASNVMSFEDYIEMRRMFLTVGIFYNDRIFGEIHALLRVLNLPTFGWIDLLHNDVEEFKGGIAAIYDGFTADTKAELWDSPSQLLEDVTGNINAYAAGEAGGNIIYKYRAKSIIDCFPELHATAFKYLRKYLAQQGVNVEEAVDELERYSRMQKLELLDTTITETQDFEYDIPKLIGDASFARQGGTLEELHYPISARISHTEQQRETIRRELDFYGDDIAGLTMVLSRFPLKRFWRRANVLGDGVPPIPPGTEPNQAQMSSIS